MSAVPKTGHLQPRDGHRALLFTPGSLTRRVLYYTIYVFYTLLNKIKFIFHNTYNNLHQF